MQSVVDIKISRMICTYIQLLFCSSVLTKISLEKQTNRAIETMIQMSC